MQSVKPHIIIALFFVIAVNSETTYVTKPTTKTATKPAAMPATNPNNAIVLLEQHLRNQTTALSIARKKSLAGDRVDGIISNAGSITGDVDRVLDDNRCGSHDFWRQTERQQLDNEWSLTESLVCIEGVLVAQLGTAMKRSLVSDVLREFRSTFDAVRDQRAQNLLEKRARFERWLRMAAEDVRRLAAASQHGDAVEAQQRYALLNREFRKLMRGTVQEYWTGMENSLRELFQRLRSSMGFMLSYSTYLKSHNL